MERNMKTLTKEYKDKRILKYWREFNRSAMTEYISPELKSAIEKSDNIRLKLQKQEIEPQAIDDYYMGLSDHE